MINAPSKVIEAPNGTIMRVGHIVAVTPLFESSDLGTDAFAVYTVGCEEPFVFTAPDVGEGSKNAAKRKANTAALQKDFVNQWIVSLDGSPFFKN